MEKVAKEYDTQEGDAEGNEEGHCYSSGDSCIKEGFEEGSICSEFLGIEKVFRKLVDSEEGEDKEERKCSLVFHYVWKYSEIGEKRQVYFYISRIFRILSKVSLLRVFPYSLS